MPTLTTPPRIWIGCLAAYNAGRLHGEWVDAAQDAEDLTAAAKHVIATSPAWQLDGHAEEWFLADNEGFGDTIGEYTPLDEVARIAAALTEHGDPLLAYLSHEDQKDDETISQFEERYRGEWDSESDFTDNLIDDFGTAKAETYLGPRSEYRYAGMPDHHAHLQDVLDKYFDSEAWGRETMQDYYSVSTGHGTYYVFSQYG